MAPREPEGHSGSAGGSAPSSRDEERAWRGRRFGPYEPLAEIARGGMGAVFVARAHGGPAAGGEVALKLLRRDLAPTHRRAFLREARVTAALHHPNVVRTLDVGEDGEDVYLAMELVTGVTLAQLLARLDEHEIPPSPWVGAYVVASAARGLHAAHELRGEDGTPLGLVHRDVSPQNILLDFDGRVLLADFGIAKFAHDGTTSVDGTLKGKFSYMSPEQIRADSLDRRSDVFGLGAVLYEAVTGVHAFGGRGPAEIVAQVLHGGVHDPRDHRADLPELLAKVTARCLATERDDRYPTVAAVAADLEVVLADAPEPAPDVLADLLAEHFAKERERFARIRTREMAPTISSRPNASPAAFAPTQRSADARALAAARVASAATPAAAAVLDDPSTLEGPRPGGTMRSAAPKRGEGQRLAGTETPPPSVHVSGPPTWSPPWRTRITWLLAAIVAGVAITALVLAVTSKPPSAPLEPGAASALARERASPQGPDPTAVPAPSAWPPSPPAVTPSPTVVAEPELRAPTGKPGAASPPSSRPAPRPTAAPSSPVFRDW